MKESKSKRLASNRQGKQHHVSGRAILAEITTRIHDSVTDLCTRLKSEGWEPIADGILTNQESRWAIWFDRSEQIWIAEYGEAKQATLGESFSFYRRAYEASTDSNSVGGYWRWVEMIDEALAQTQPVAA